MLNWNPGQFTDDTEMAIPIARLVASGMDLCAPSNLDHLVSDWCHWVQTARDVGVQTRAVLSPLRAYTEANARLHAEQFHKKNSERSGGNGGLMRAFPIALAYPDDINGLTEATRRTVQLTHWENTAYEAALIWNLLIQNAYKNQRLEVEIVIGCLRNILDDADWWLETFRIASSSRAADFHRTNGWVVHTIMAAWSCIANTDNYVDAVEMAVRGGGDTDTVACVVGALAGAKYGFSAIPESWRYALNGLDGVDQHELLRLALRTPAATSAGQRVNDWPFVDKMPPSSTPILVQHPHDEGLFLGNLAASDMGGFEKVGLCRLGRSEIDQNTHIFWLVDEDGQNENILGTFRDCVRTITRLRADGGKVLLFCQAGQSRTPAMAIAYSMWGCGKTFTEAYEAVVHSNPGFLPRDEFLEVLRNLK